MSDARIVAAAVANNAAWCDLVCRSAGLPTVLGPDLWSTPRRSPDAYPDAVTLRPGVPVADVLAAVDDSDGASVKDSFADLDLAPHGWSVLFEAQWLTRPAVSRDGPRTAVADRRPRHAAALARRPRLGGDPAGRPRRPGRAAPARRRRATARSPSPRSTAPARVPTPSSACRTCRCCALEPELVWSELAMLARRELGAHPLVGYESGPDLLAPVAVGFEPVGRLRVWVR